MKHARVFMISGLMAMTATPAALADSDSRFYASGVAGIGFLGSENLNYRDGTTNVTEKADFDASFNGGGTLGYYLNDNWRVEGELMYRRNDLKDITIDGIGASTDGDFASLSVGLSALYEFNPFGKERVRAYAGAGVVFVQEIDIDFEIDGEETSFETDEVGFQVQLGARYDINDNLFVDAGLRYLTVSGAELEFPADTSRIVESDYSPLSVSIGVGWRF